MRAIVFHRHGPPSELRIEEFPEPEARLGDAIIEVGATSLNGFDPMILAGTTGLKTPLPMIPCGDIAGEIVELGAEVAGGEWKIGDRVCPHPFVLGESGAILTYLADKHQWHDLYGDPATDAGRKRRAKVDQYLHAHRRGARESFVHVIPHMRKDKIASGRFPPELLAAGAKNFDAAVHALETGWLKHSADILPQSLAPRPFLNVGRVVATGMDDTAFDGAGSGRGPSLADIVAYSELGPLAPELNALYDFEAQGAPRVAAWLEAMRGVDAHDAAFAVNAALGPLADGRDVTMDRIKEANAAAAKAIAAEDPRSSIDFGAKLEPLEEGNGAMGGVEQEMT